LLSYVKKLLLFLEAEYLSESFGLFLAELFLLSFNILLLGYLGYTIDIADIIGLALPNAFGIAGILLVARGDTSFFILFITRTRSYIKFSYPTNHFTKSEVILVNRGLFWHNKKGRRL
jgi:hypothetical protein